MSQEAEPALYSRLEGLFNEIVEAHLERGRLCRGRSAAVEQKQKELADALSGATALTGERVLLLAVAANSLPDVVRLDEEGASRAGDNGSLLHVAARFADPQMLEYLVSAGFEIEEHAGASGPALLVAVSENRMANVAWLIEYGANVNAADDEGGTVLHHSLVCRDQELVNYLLAAGAIPAERVLAAGERLGISFGSDQK